MGYCVRACKYSLAGGNRLAAGCICAADYAERCREILEAFRNYEPHKDSLAGIDFELAEFVCGAFGSGDAAASGEVIAAGCSLHIAGANIPSGTTTGGILGDPYEPPESSEDDAESLSHGFSLMTLSGSPGLAADTDCKTVREALEAIKKFKDAGCLIDEGMLDRLFESFGIHTALLVFDGTGDGQEAFLAARDAGGTRIYR